MLRRSSSYLQLAPYVFLQSAGKTSGTFLPPHPPNAFSFWQKQSANLCYDGSQSPSWGWGRPWLLPVFKVEQFRESFALRPAECLSPILRGRVEAQKASCLSIGGQRRLAIGRATRHSTGSCKSERAPGPGPRLVDTLADLNEFPTAVMTPSLSPLRALAGFFALRVLSWNLPRCPLFREVGLSAC